MKKLFCILLAAALCVSAALALPRYPAPKGSVHDAASVLTVQTAQDLAELSKEISRQTDLDLYVATVDFLDGATLSDYGAGLRAHWSLEEEDLLLLLAVGEDQFACFGGKKTERLLPSAALSKLLSQHFEQPFLHQEYDAAIAALAPALAEEINRACDADVSVSGLFGVSAASDPDWLSRWQTGHASLLGEPEEEPDLRRRVTQEDEDTGFSLGKIILTLFLLSAIFGKKRDKGRHGCGCGPLGPILAALGLWKLWDD